MITTIFFAAVTFPKRAPRIIIHLARNAENGGVLMSVTLLNLNHSFIFPVPVPDPDPDPDFRVFHTPRSESNFKNIPAVLILYRRVDASKFKVLTSST